jgi:hypothetical protein
LLPEPTRQLSVADVEAVFDRKLREWSKQKDIVGKVSALAPLTVELRSGDVPVARRDPSVVLAVGDQVQLVHDGAGYALVGRLADVDDPATGTPGAVPFVNGVSGICLWPANQPIPAGWEEVTALRGRFVVSPNGTTFVSGTVGGSTTHNHGGNTGGPSGYQGTMVDGANRTGDHTHTISNSTFLPPWTAEYIWIRRTV